MFQDSRPTTPEIHQAAVIAARRCAQVVSVLLLPDQRQRALLENYRIIREMLEAFHARKGK